MNMTLTRAQIWSGPLALGVSSVIGLVSALFADGLWDALSWLTLAAPVAVCVRGLRKPRTPVRNQQSLPSATSNLRDA